MNKAGFAFGAWLFLRVLAVIHAIAFISFWVQLDGLVGPRGLLPAERFFGAVHDRFGASAFAQLPSLCWLFGAGWFLHALCAVGVALALLLFAGIAPALCLALLWACYLSLACAGQIFFNFQWDALLLETTLLAVFLAPWALRPGWRPAEPPRLARWLLWWLLFRLMLLSGLVKLASGDPSWQHLTALVFHHETQPLPTPLAWYASQLPALVCPFVLRPHVCRRTPRPVRAGRAQGRAPCRGACDRRPAGAHRADGQLHLFQSSHRRALPALPGRRLVAPHGGELAQASSPAVVEIAGADPDGSSPGVRRGKRLRYFGRPPRWLLCPFAAFVLCFTSVEAMSDFVPYVASSQAFEKLNGVIGPFRSLNNYGLFTVMTTTRPELIFEGSNDGIDWRPYEFPHKPGDPARRPDFVAPHQPRLDWQLWFAALEPPGENRWVLGLCEHLLRGTPQVLSLFSVNPFPGRPPRYIRVVRYEYHFTDAVERARTGNWWKRTVLDFYVPPASLN